MRLTIFQEIPAPQNVLSSQELQKRTLSVSSIFNSVPNISFGGCSNRYTKAFLERLSVRILLIISYPGML